MHALPHVSPFTSSHVSPFTSSLITDRNELLQATDIVQDELTCYGNLSHSNSMEVEDVITWWCQTQKVQHPCLYQIVMAFFRTNPGSGGLECNFGALGDVVTHRRTSLAPGLVEAEMFLWWNRERVAIDNCKVKALPGQLWKAEIPAWPIFPDDYMEEDETEEDEMEEDEMEAQNENDKANDDESKSSKNSLQ